MQAMKKNTFYFELVELINDKDFEFETLRTCSIWSLDEDLIVTFVNVLYCFVLKNLDVKVIILYVL